MRQLRTLRNLPVCLLSFVAGCALPGRPTWYELADGRRVPNRWTLDVRAPRDATYPLRYDALYVSVPGTVSAIYRARWYRFWPDGQVAVWDNYVSEPDRGALVGADGDDFRRSAPGRYRVTGDELFMEFLGFAECGPEYMRWRGRIRPDGSIILHKREAGAGSPDFEVYRPHPVDGMERLPDW